MQAFDAIVAYNTQEAYEYFKKALSIFPNDPVASYYTKMFVKGQETKIANSSVDQLVVFCEWLLKVLQRS